MSDDFEALAKETLKELRRTGEEFWDQLNEDQRPIVEQAARDAAQAMLGLVKEPERADIHRETLLAVKVTLAGEAVLASLRAQRRLKTALLRGLQKLATLGLAVLA